MLNAIHIIDPGTRVPELDCFNQISQASKLSCHYHLPALFGTSSLVATNEDNIAGIIILGSGASVCDDIPWQNDLCNWLKPKIHGGISCLGICYGHQLIAHMFGGKVAPLYKEGKKLTGTRTTKISQNRLNIVPMEYEVVVSHIEVCLDIPQEFNILAKSPAVEIDGLEHKHLPIWTFQSHPEATQLFLTNQSINIEQPKKDRALNDGEKIISSFLAHCNHAKRLNHT